MWGDISNACHRLELLEGPATVWLSSMQLDTTIETATVTFDYPFILLPFLQSFVAPISSGFVAPDPTVGCEMVVSGSSPGRAELHGGS